MQSTGARPQDDDLVSMRAARPSAIARWHGVLATVVTLAVIEGLRRAGAMIPNPGAIYITAVVYATFTGGLVPGIVSGALSILYGAYFFSDPGSLFEYTAEESRRVLIWLAAIPAIVAMVGLLRIRNERSAEALRISAAREAEQRARAAAAAALVRSQTTLETTLSSLRETTAHLRLIGNQVPAVVWTTDAGLRFTSAQGSGVGTLGLRPDEAIGKTIYELFGTSDDTFVPVDAHRRALAGETVRFEAQWAGQSYQTVVEPFRDSAGTIVGTIGIALDITERKRSEAALRESEKRHRLLFESSPVPMWVYDRETLRFLEVNDAAVAQYGYSREEFARMTLHDVRPREDIPMMLDWLKEMNEGRSRSGRWRHQRKDGSIVEVDVTSDGFEFAGRPARMVLALDVTERVKAERAISDAEKRYRSLVEHSPMGILVHQEGRFVYANEVAARLLRAPAPGDLIGRDIMTIVHPDYAARARQRIESVMSTGKPAPLVEQKLIRLDGSVIDVEIVGGATLFAGRPAVQVIFNDISERKRLMSDLIQAQKMEAVGHLAAGITHDFNNLLTGIFAYIGLARASLKPGDPAAVALDGVASAATQAAGVTRSLLTFSRRAAPEVSPVDLRAVVRESVGLIRPSLPASINIVAPADDAGARAIWVRADPVQIKQAVVNLALNARDVMPRGGVLTITLGTSNGGAEARLSVSDTGPGIPASIRSRIFDPFFTTKDNDEGTGLGLAIVHAIVKSHGGSIELESPPGRGATFAIVLPTIRASTTAGADDGAPDRTSNAVVAVTSDNRQVRAVIATALRRAGHAVLEADDPAVMSEILHRYLHDLRLAVVDAAAIDSPAMNSGILLRTRKPGLPVVLLTASAETPAALSGPDAHVVIKPFQVAQLTELVGRILNSPADGSSAPATEAEQ